MSRFSFIVPFHRDVVSLARCLSALDPLPPDSEILVAADGAVDDCRLVASMHDARVIEIEGPSGPAAARNAASAAATGDVLVFIDADVVVSRAGLAQLARVLSEQSQVAAVFGAYDDEPADTGFMSQYKNLSHSFIHRSSATRARTFWAGFGAVRREAFQRVGGFDERFVRPCVEDIDLGYRLTNGGYEVVLDPLLSACHLKRWTLRSAIASDVFDRGIPWTQLIFRYGSMANDLNLRAEYRWSIVLAYLALASLGFGILDWRWLAGVAVCLAGLTILNRAYYRFFCRKRGGFFAVRAWSLHFVHHICNGASFAAGALLFGVSRYLGLRLPGALPPDSWSAAA